jgi:predicted metal-binding protein
MCSKCTKTNEEIMIKKREIIQVCKKILGIAFMMPIVFSGGYATCAAEGTTAIVPKHIYKIEESAKCNGICSIAYSVDGKVVNMPVKLFVTKDGKKIVSKSSDMVIRWTVQTTDAKQNSSVQYEACLK